MAQALQPTRTLPEDYDEPRSPRPVEQAWLSRERALALALIAATILTFYLCYRLVQPFLPAIAWAVALAVVGRPVHRIIEARLPNRDVAAGIAVAAVALLLLLPFSLLVQNLVEQGAAQVEQAQVSGLKWREALSENRALRPLIQWVDRNIDFESELRKTAGVLAGNISIVVTNSVWTILQLLLTLFVLFYLFRDRDLIVRALVGLVPLQAGDAGEIMRRMRDTIYVTIYGSVAVAVTQGILGGMMFWWLGIPGALLWGTAMALLAVIPWLGPFVVWLPFAAYYAINGEWRTALILLVWGSVVVGFIDNLLYPVLVGHRLRLHTLLVFFAIVGGIFVFGASGIILGPCILAFADALIEVWRRRTAGGKSLEEGLAEPQIEVAS